MHKNPNDRHGKDQDLVDQLLATGESRVVEDGAVAEGGEAFELTGEEKVGEGEAEVVADVEVGAWRDVGELECARC